ncbi:hypothetical protein SK128_019212 [Halocaridina rubra]|uniref:G-protein coupled receptors family 2 profile 2 domain-containing protein n=1 Tax=Halocaridina rubra TaxID=373956 RepID=A0AAN8XKC1_HALRR
MCMSITALKKFSKLKLSSYIFLSTLLVLWNSISATAIHRKEYPVVPWEDLWEELDEMTMGKDYCLVKNALCWHNDTIGTRSTSSPVTKNDLRVQCYCDNECVRYGDCCRDKAEADWGDGREEGSSQYSCRKMQTMSTIGLLMAETCLPEYSGKEVEALCMQKVPRMSYTYVLDLPVTSSDTNITYVNIHCAICNNDANHLYTWNVTINCNTMMIQKDFTMSDFMSEAHYIPSRRHWQRYTYRSLADKKSKVYRDRYFCTLEVVEFKNETSFIQNYGGRLCIFPKSICEEGTGRNALCKEQIRHCDPAWPDLLDKDKCERYSYMVSHTNDRKQETFYKNPHCARCNFINVSDSSFQCVNLHDGRNFDSRRGRNLPVVFSVLMDFQGKECYHENEMWDPIHKKCQKIYCGKLYRLENGICVENEMVEEVIENSSLLNQSCPKIRVTNFFALDDGSVFVNSSRKKYRNGDYEIVDNISILVCNDLHYLATFSEAHSYLTAVVLIISVTALALHMGIYILVPRFRNLPGKNLFSLSCSLFIAHMLFLTGMRATANHGLCVFISAALHYSWIASFCWMNVMSVDICRTFTSQVYRGDLKSQRTYIFYSVYAWGIPSIVIGLAFLFEYTDLVPDYKPEYGTTVCWINKRSSLVLFFILPIGAIFLENVILYMVTVCGICKQAKAASYAGTRSQSFKDANGSTSEKKVKNLKDMNMKSSAQVRRIRKDRVRLLLYVKLGLIQGLSWGLGFLAAFTDIPAMWYPFTIFNGLQGAFIFIAFDMKRKVGESVYEAITGKQWKQQQSTKNTNTSTMPQSTSSHNRSSKSYRSDRLSDSEGEEGGKQQQEDTCWSPDGKVNSSSPTQRKTTFQRSALRQSLKKPSKQTSAAVYTRNHMRNGDLRGSIVKGKFDDEKGDDFTKADETESESVEKEDRGTSLRRTKSDLQRVVDLLQQLQHSKNSGDLQGVLQQIIAKSGSSVNGKLVKNSNLSKCVSMSEGINPVLQDKGKYASATSKPSVRSCQ